MDLGFPEGFAVLPVEAEHGLDLTIVVGGRQEHLVSHHGRRAVSAAGNGGFPEDVFRFAPLQGRLLPRLGDAVAGRPAPPRPVGCGDGDGGLGPKGRGLQEEQAGQGQSEEESHGKVFSVTRRQVGRRPAGSRPLYRGRGRTEITRDKASRPPPGKQPLRLAIGAGSACHACPAARAASPQLTRVGVRVRIGQRLTQGSGTSPLRQPLTAVCRPCVGPERAGDFGLRRSRGDRSAQHPGKVRSLHQHSHRRVAVDQIGFSAASDPDTRSPRLWKHACTLSGEGWSRRKPLAPLSPC